jgi:hypothetical protein
MRCLNNPDDFFEIVAEIAEPINEILSDAEIRESYRKDSIFLFVGKVIRHYKDHVKRAVAALDGEITPDEAFAKYSTAEIVKLFVQIKNDPLFDDLKQAFSSAQQNTGA